MLLSFAAVGLALLAAAPQGVPPGGRLRLPRRTPFAAGTAAPGPGWHRQDTLYCSDCHTIHNSQYGQPMRYDGGSQPVDNLLRGADEVRLCLHCHDGSNPLAPDIVEPVGYVSDPTGGWFQASLGVADPNGHDLLMAAPQRAPGSSESFILECSSCHDVHGSANYRNLLVDPPGSGDNGHVEVVVDQTVTPNGSNASQVYIPSNLKDRRGMGEFCNSCHDNFHGKTLGEEGGTQRPWLRHPQEEAIFGKAHADYTWWSQNQVNRARVETDDDLVPSQDDRVFCLSCHKAHGSGRPDSLIYADGQRRRSTCQQCHNQ